MAKQAYLTLLSDFMYHVGSTIGFDNAASKAFYPQLEHALNSLEVLHLPKELHRSPVLNAPLIERMNLIEAAIAEKIYQHGEARQAFLHYDTDATGFMTPQEFSRCVANLGILLSNEELQYLVQKYDSSRNGMINYTDFISIGAKLQGMMSESQSAYSEALLSPYHPRQHHHHRSEDNDPAAGLDDEERTTRAQELAAMIRAKLYQRFKSPTDLFCHLNVDQSARLSLEELQEGLFSLGVDVSREDLCELTSLFRTIDTEQERQAGVASTDMSVHEFCTFLDSTTSMRAFLPSEEQNAAEAKQQSTSTTTQTRFGSDPEYALDDLAAMVSDREDSRGTPVAAPTSVVSRSLEVVTREIAQMLRDTGKKLRDIFTKMDSDGNGSLSCDNLYTGLRKLGIKSIPRCDTDRVLAFYDETGSGTIEYHEFVKMMQSLYQDDANSRP